MSIKKTLLATAVTTAMGATAIEAQASHLYADWSGLFTILNPDGIGLQNVSYPYYGDPTWGYGFRTQVSGTMTFDLGLGSGLVGLAGLARRKK